VIIVTCRVLLFDVHLIYLGYQMSFYINHRLKGSNYCRHNLHQARLDSYVYLYCKQHTIKQLYLILVFLFKLQITSRTYKVQTIRPFKVHLIFPNSNRSYEDLFRVSKTVSSVVKALELIPLMYNRLTLVHKLSHKEAFTKRCNDHKHLSGFSQRNIRRYLLLIIRLPLEELDHHILKTVPLK
jgi:hypothetical protein